ncbi:MAG: hypothetical protein NVS3B25_26470 [Hymenobacter sp.]
MEQFLRGKMMADLVFDKLLQFDMERQLEILGEAATHVSAETQATWTSINWQVTKDFCNLIAHEYFRVDLAKLWRISQDLIPGLRLVVENLFTDLDRQFSPDAGV